MATVSKRAKIDDEKPSTSKKHKKHAKPAAGEISTDWDVDDYRTEYESEEHWELRRSFMLAHKDRFEEDRLVCLAQTFINMEFMGCKYPSDTMLLVAELSKEIAEDFRMKRAQRLKRTFVSASDAAEQRAKGRRTGSNSQTVQEREIQLPSGSNLSRNKPQQVPRCEFQASGGSRDRLCFGGGNPINLFDGLRFGNLILYLAGGRSCIRNSCSMAKIPYDERQSEKESSEISKTAEILVNNRVIATGKGDNLKAAKLAAYRQAVLLVQAHCYSIKLNAARETIKIEKKKHGLNINVTMKPADNVGQSDLNANNKGYRMMRLMGWTGGGLGRLKQGRQEPLGYLFKNNRMGLGSNDPTPNLENYRKIIENYVNSDDLRDMQFEPTFSKEERATFHQIVSQFGLRSSSYGSGNSRRLLISKKVSYGTILNEILIRRNPKFCERYFVQVPIEKAHLFPGHVAALDLDNITE